MEKLTNWLWWKYQCRSAGIEKKDTHNISFADGHAKWYKPVTAYVLPEDIGYINR